MPLPLHLHAGRPAGPGARSTPPSGWEYGYNPSRETPNVGIWEASSTPPQNLVLAASAMAAVPTLVFFLVFQRNILAGLTAGSLKG